MERQVTIITGGSSGIGKAIARQFAKQGHHIVIIGRTPEKLKQTKVEIEQFENQVHCFPMDVREPDKAQEMVQSTLDQFGRIDTLINNAAGNFVCPAEDLSLNGWHAVVNIVLNGTWYCTQAVGKYWISTKQKGGILNIVAPYAMGAGAGMIHSASAKAGVLAMTRTLALEWGAKYGIRVNALAPGPIQNTGATRQLNMDENYENLVSSIPLKRFGYLDEIAKLVSFIFSGNIDYMNGECITIDGGMSLYTKRTFIDL